LWVIFALLDPDPDPLTRLNPDPDPQPCLEDTACSLPVVLSCGGGRSSSWRPGLVAVTAFTIGLEEEGGSSLLLVHSWQLLTQPSKGTPPEEGLAFRVLAKSCLLNRGGSSSVYFVRLARLASSGDSSEDYGGTIVVRLNDLADFPFIRPLASSLKFVESSAALLFEPDKEGQELLRRKSRHSGEPVLKLRQRVVYRIEEREEACKESWEQLDDATVAAMREDEELNIRYLPGVALPETWIFRRKFKASDWEKVYA
jgi:hypothetical protein